MATPEDFERLGNYARLLNKDQNIDRRTCQRVVPMEVLSLGFSRTGTLSMQKALEILGYPTYHFSSFYDNVRDCDMWMEALNAKFYGKGKLYEKKDFDRLLGHVGAVTDLPCIAFSKELIEFYPDSKIVLVERNVDSWYKSWMILCTAGSAPLKNFLKLLDPTFLGRISAVGTAGVKERTGGGKNLDEIAARSKEEYIKHYAYVRQITPADRLLNFELKDGWEPLCKFLGKPIPDVPFPHLNEAQSIKTVFVEMNKKAMKNIVQNVTVVLTAVAVPAVAIWWIRRR